MARRPARQSCQDARTRPRLVSRGQGTPFASQRRSQGPWGLVVKGADVQGTVETTGQAPPNSDSSSLPRGQVRAEHLPLVKPAAEFQPRCDQLEVGLYPKEKANGAFWRLLQFPRTKSEVSSEPSELVDPTLSLRWVEMQTIGPRGRHEIAPSVECRAP